MYQYAVKKLLANTSEYIRSSREANLAAQAQQMVAAESGTRALMSTSQGKANSDCQCIMAVPACIAHTAVLDDESMRSHHQSSTGLKGNYCNAKHTYALTARAYILATLSNSLQLESLLARSLALSLDTRRGLDNRAPLHGTIRDRSLRQEKDDLVDDGRG
eukprot:CAMPEP_0119300382 /NCGR_PEP_ID=MMETSP1333-20130426/2336_1 /TAXON_ID=418940 /ORGANISM="Scyphosphaera apsteinii, Strain RCC1455" /LENGTH=160 /DNA_ID=CAMNT_0007302129 /DNA_START=208 /DNA_END=687 /DNA_ORIENTATION=-